MGSCRDVTGEVMEDPKVGGDSVAKLPGIPHVALEYPMKPYGIMDRQQTKKKTYSRATMVKFTMTAPVQAEQYIRKQIYSDPNILRLMILGHTRTFKHLGEDNELHL